MRNIQLSLSKTLHVDGTIILLPLILTLQENINKTDLKIKLVEKAGTALANILKTSDLRKEQKCNRQDCPVCTRGGK